MSTFSKPIESLRPADFLPFKAFRILSENDARDECILCAVDSLPTKSLASLVIGTSVRFANGKVGAALLSNLDECALELSEHFLTITIFRDDGERFHLARYHDFDYEQRGPSSLAEFLGVPVVNVFPIQYQLPAKLLINGQTVSGEVLAEPRVRLSRAEVIALAVP